VFFDHFALAHMSDHFALVGSNEVGLLEPDTMNVLLMLFSVDPNQIGHFELIQIYNLNLCILSEFVTLPLRQLIWSCKLIPVKQVISFLDTL
jgi:hypothetical protein